MNPTKQFDSAADTPTDVTPVAATVRTPTPAFTIDGPHYSKAHVRLTDDYSQEYSWVARVLRADGTIAFTTPPKPSRLSARNAAQLFIEIEGRGVRIGDARELLEPPRIDKSKWSVCDQYQEWAKLAVDEWDGQDTAMLLEGIREKFGQDEKQFYSEAMGEHLDPLAYSRLAAAAERNKTGFGIFLSPNGHGFTAQLGTTTSSLVALGQTLAIAVGKLAAQSPGLFAGERPGVDGEKT